jgi:hypothetical protein
MIESALESLVADGTLVKVRLPGNVVIYRFGVPRPEG